VKSGRLGPWGRKREEKGGDSERKLVKSNDQN